MIFSSIMERAIKFFVPQQMSHYVTKPMMALVIFIAFFLFIDSVAHGSYAVHDTYDIFLIGLTQAPFVGVAFCLLVYLDGMQRKLANLALTDVLTGLPNRRNFMDETAVALKNQPEGFMLILDADHFKLINDTYGHAIGDDCLKAIAQRLRATCAHGDFIGRIGGEEFGAYLPQRTEAEIIEIGKIFSAPFFIQTPELPEPMRFTMSIGAAETRPNEELIQLIRRADEALYEAKMTGRKKLVLWRQAIRNSRNLAMG